VGAIGQGRSKITDNRSGGTIRGEDEVEKYIMSKPVKKESKKDVTFWKPQKKKHQLDEERIGTAIQRKRERSSEVERNGRRAKSLSIMGRRTSGGRAGAEGDC